MNATSQFHPVQLPAIDYEDKTYCLTPWEEPPSEDLLSSIKRFGILHPPILQKGDDNSYCIVTGRKRIDAIRHIDPECSILCRVIQKDIAETSIFSLLLEEATRGKALSIVEQIVFLEKLLLVTPMEEVLPMLEPMGYKAQKHILNDLLKLRSLSTPALLLMHQGTLLLKNARKLRDLSPLDQEIIVQLITDLHLGGSKQQKLIDLSKELIMRKKIPLQEIIANFHSENVQGHHLNIPQHASTLLSWLTNECFPRVSQAENNFKRQVARLDLPSSMCITHTPAFEDEEITLSLRFPDWASLNITLAGINKLMQEE